MAEATNPLIVLRTELYVSEYYDDGDYEGNQSGKRFAQYELQDVAELSDALAEAHKEVSAFYAAGAVEKRSHEYYSHRRPEGARVFLHTNWASLLLRRSVKLIAPANEAAWTGDMRLAVEEESRRPAILRRNIKGDVKFTAPKERSGVKRITL